MATRIGSGGLSRYRLPAKKKISALPAATPATTPVPGSVSQPFQQALDTLSGTSGDIEKLYQSGKRRTMSNIAMQSVNAGMANTLNMPAADLAYEEAVRPGTNVTLAQLKAGVLQNLGGTAAGIYGTNVGAQTSRYGADVASGTAMSGQALQFSSNRANQELQKYIADLKYGGQSNTSGGNTLGAPAA